VEGPTALLALPLSRNEKSRIRAESKAMILRG
jgi:hypothetical protein